MGKKATVLVVDDERGVRQSFNMVLKDDYKVLLAATGEEALEVFTENLIDVVLLDILLPDSNGIDLLEKMKELDPSTEIIMITAVKEVQTAVKAIKSGAYEYVIKPFLVDDVLAVIQRALEKRTLVREITYLRGELERIQPFEEMVGKDSKMTAIFDLISNIAENDGAVLIQGESGTGKELVARAIHNLSNRKDGPFVVINSAIPPTLIESTVFGYCPGAFTGATKTTLGKLEIANKGTVFLDDVDSLSLEMQPKFLRVIQEKEFERLGSTKVIKTDVRFLAATNKDLKELIRQGLFREDLYFRLNVYPIFLPPLRERRGDIPLLLEYFLKQHSRATSNPTKSFSKKALQVLTDEYHWPGNIRELQNTVARLCATTKKKVIHLEDVFALNVIQKEIKGMTLKEAVHNFEKQYIGEVLSLVDGNRKKASELLAVHRNTLTAKIKELGLGEDQLDILSDPLT